MKKLITFLGILFLSNTTFGQYVEGTVVDSNTKKPIKGVHISIENVENGTQTYSNGKYYLKLPRIITGAKKIFFSHIGYKTLEMPFDKKKTVYNVELQQQINALDEVSISKKRHFNSSLKFKQLKPMQSSLHAFGSILIDNKIYVTGGNASFYLDGTKRTLMRLENSDLSELSFNQFLRYNYVSYQTDFFKGDMHVYNIESNSWEKTKKLFKKRAYHNTHFYNNELFLVGGTNLSVNKKKEFLDSSIEILDLNTSTTIIDETNPHQAVNFASVFYKDQLFVFGGSTKTKENGSKEYSDNIHLFDFKTGFWYNLDSMTSAKETSGILVKDKIYLIGGFNKTPLSEIETFDLNTQKWSALGNLFYGISNPAITQHKNTIYIYNNGKIFTLNTLTNKLNEYYIELEVQNSKMHFANNKLYIIGGIRVNEYSINPSSSLYSIDLNEFNKTQVRRSKTL